MRVAINAQLRPGNGAGGVESVLIGLLRALGRLDGPEEFVVIGPEIDSEWLDPFLGPNQRLVTRRSPAAPPASRQPNIVRRVARRARRLIAPRAPDAAPRQPWPRMDVSDGFIESLKCDVIHFPWQEFVIGATPSVYNPHDLQHRHFPEFFTIEQRARRDHVYAIGCNVASAVAAGSDWVRDDLVNELRVAPSKIQVIPWAPATQAYAAPSAADVRAARARYALPDVFALYPAMTWPHKNHLRLLDALALLRDTKAVRVNLVCTGHRNEFWGVIERRLCELGLEDQVKFVGVVTTDELRAIYSLAEFIVIPTLFEAASGPLYEAWHDGKPVTCSDVTSLPEQAAGAALLFDPTSTASVAAAVERMAKDAALRHTLTERGRARLAAFDWERTAKAYRALYRRIARRPLSEEDVSLLRHNWMRTDARRDFRVDDGVAESRTQRCS